MLIAIHQDKRIRKTCIVCNSEFLVYPSVEKKGNRKFCSSECFGIKRAEFFRDKYGGEKRTCRVCQIEKHTNEFSPDNRISHKRQTICKKCKAEWMRLDRIKNPMKYRFHDIKKMYGIDNEEYNLLFIKQNGVCAICHQPEKRKRGYLHIDHDHSTGKIRGLLCTNCNLGIGNLKENIKFLESAIEYLSFGERRAVR